MTEKKKLDKNKVLDHIIRLERRRKIKKFSIIAAFVVLFGVLYSFSVVMNYDRVKFSNEVNAIIEAVEETENGNIKLSLRLPSDEIVSTTVNATPGSLTKEQAIKVLEEELANGQMRYSLILE